MSQIKAKGREKYIVRWNREEQPQENIRKTVKRNGLTVNKVWPNKTKHVWLSPEFAWHILSFLIIFQTYFLCIFCLDLSVCVEEIVNFKLDHSVGSKWITVTNVWRKTPLLPQQRVQLPWQKLRAGENREGHSLEIYYRVDTNVSPPGNSIWWDIMTV